MATRKRTKAKKAAVPMRTRTRTIVKRATSRKRKTSGGKFDIINSIIMPAAGAGLGIIAGNAIGKMIPSIPYGKALIPFGLSFVTGSMLKQPGLAAGMAAAGGISLLQSLSPSMFADETQDFLNSSALPLMTFSDANLDAYQSALINGQFNDEDEDEDEMLNDGSIKFDAMGRPIYVSPTGELQYV